MVTAPVLFGKLYVMPIVTEFQSAYDQVEVSALFVDRVVNFIDEGWMSASHRPAARLILCAPFAGQVRRVVVVGSPAYLGKGRHSANTGGSCRASPCCIERNLTHQRLDV